MLKKISPLISPDLLATLCRMGHGEEILFADAHFPVHQYARQVIRADGLGVADLLNAILPLFEVDSYVESPVMMMAAVAGDELDESVEATYRRALNAHQPNLPPIHRLERREFYERSRAAHAIVATGDVAKYANLILTKGVTPV